MSEATARITEEQVVEALRDVYDPEIPINVYDLGLIYGIQISDENDGANDVRVEMTFDPPWNPDMLKPEGKKLLGLD